MQRFFHRNILAGLGPLLRTAVSFVVLAIPTAGLTYIARDFLQLPLLDSVAILFLGIAILVGLSTLHRHRGYFAQFTSANVLQLRGDACLYVIVIVSTALCVVDLFLRTFWAFEVGWNTIDAKWSLLWMWLHIFLGLFFIGLHLFTYAILNQVKFRELLRERESIKNTDENHRATRCTSRDVCRGDHCLCAGCREGNPNT